MYSFPLFNVLPSPVPKVEAPNSVQLTRHWEMDVCIADKRLLCAPTPRHEVSAITMGDQHVANVLPTSTCCPHLTRHPRKAARARSHPYTRANPPSSSPFCRSSTATRKAQTKVKQVKSSSDGSKKPPPACAFCRGRKIACADPRERRAGNAC